MVTNCKGLAMEASSQTMNVKENVNTFSDLTWCSMRKKTCTYNELGEFLMVSGIGKRTGHSTLKKCKGKSLSPHKARPQIQRSSTQLQDNHYITVMSTTALLRTQLFNYKYKDGNHFQKKHLNTAGPNARDSFLMKCRRGLESWLLMGGPYNLICKSHK